jgi:uncharacterized membrane protein YkvI
MGTEGVLLLNIALVPGLIILSLAIAAYYITNADVATMKILSHINLVGTNWLLATILYVSYNFVLGAVILSSLGCTAEEGGKKGALLGGVIIGLMAAVMSLSLVLEGVPGTDRGIPMLVMAHKIHPIIYYAYFFALWSSILTTAIGNGYTILKRLQQIVYISRPLGCILVVVSTFPFLYWSFSTMVAVIYPMIGYLGFIFLLAIPLRLLQVKILQFKRR